MPLTYLWEVSLTIADEKASLAATTISNNNELLGERRRFERRFGNVRVVG